jgi:TP901 family phage tail tape measure protein
MADLGTMTATVGITAKGIAETQRAIINMLNTINAKLDQTDAKLDRTFRKKVATAPIVPVFDPSTALNKIDNFTTSIFRSAQRWRTVGYLTSIVLTAPIIMFGKAAITAASDFEFSMRKTIGLAGVAKEVIKDLSAAILKMAPAVAQTPQALAEAFYFISSSGIKDNVKALDVLRVSATAATAGMGDVSEIAKLLVFSLNNYATSGMTATKAADIFTTAIKEGAVEAEGFASSLQTVLMIAAPMGVDLANVAGSMAALSLQGATAARAATYLRGMLNSLLQVKPTNQAGKALKELGIDVNDLYKLLKEKGGLLKTAIFLQDVSKQSTGNVFLKEIFANVRALQAELGLAGENVKYNIGLMNRMYQEYGALAKASEGVENTIKVRMAHIKATLAVVKTSLGMPLANFILPALQSLITTLKNIVDWFNSLGKGAQRTVIHIIGFAAAIGPLALLGSVLKYAYGGLFSFLSKGFLYITSIVKGLTGSIVSMQMASAMMPRLTNVLGKTTAGGKTAMAGVAAANAATAGAAGAGAVGAEMVGIGSVAPYIALAAAVAAVAVTIVSLIRRQNEFKRVQKDIIGQTAQEIETMHGLFQRASDVTKGTEARNNAIKTINERYGEYLRNMLTEKSSMQEITNAYNLATKAMIVNMALKTNTEVLQKHAEKTARIFGRSLGSITEMIAKQKPDMLASFYTDVYAMADEAIKVGNGKVDQETLGLGIQKIWDKYLKDVSKSTVGAYTLMGKLSEGMGRVANQRMQEIPFKNAVDALSNSANAAKYHINALGDALNNFKISDKLPDQISDIVTLMDQLKGGFGLTIKPPLLPINKWTEGMKGAIAITEDANAAAKEFFGGEGYHFNITPAADLILKGLAEQEKAFKRTEEQAKLYGVETDILQKRANAYGEALEALNAMPEMTNKSEAIRIVATAYAQAQKAAKAYSNQLKDTKKEEGETEKTIRKSAEIINELNTSLSVNAMKGKMGLPSFDINTSNLESYNKAISALADNYFELQNLPKFDLLDVTQDEGKMQTILLQINEYANKIRGITEAQKGIEDTKMLYVLQSEADAFGGLAGQIEVVNFALQAEQRNLRDMFSARYGKSPLDPKEIKKYVDEINRLEDLQVSLLNKQNLQGLTDMNDALNNASTGADLLSGRISALENTLKRMSAAGEGGTEMFKTLAEQMKTLTNAQTGIDILSNAFTQLFDGIISGGKDMGDILKGILQGVLRELSAAIAKMIAMKIVMAIIGLGKAGTVSKGLNIGQPGGIFGPGAYAKGGIVPPGYPNDTYPALLTSGERVLPKGISNITPPEYRWEDVKFVIEDDQLVGILKKKAVKNASY